MFAQTFIVTLYVNLIVNTYIIAGILINKFNLINLAYFTLHWTYIVIQHKCLNI